MINIIQREITCLLFVSLVCLYFEQIDIVVYMSVPTHIENDALCVVDLAVCLQPSSVVGNPRVAIYVDFPPLSTSGYNTIHHLLALVIFFTSSIKPNPDIQCKLLPSVTLLGALTKTSSLDGRVHVLKASGWF